MVTCPLCYHYKLRLMRPRLSFCRQRARVHCAHPWAQPCGRLSPCKSSVLTICPSTIQICLEQIWTSAGCPVRHGGRTSTTAMLSVAGTRWRHKSARSRFGRPQDARRVCAREGAHLKSCAIFASIGEICGLATGITFAQLCYTCVADIGQQFVSPAQARNLYVGGQFQ